MGRPTIYRPEFVAMAKASRRRDCTLEELADSFGVNVSTVKAWSAKYGDFYAAIHESRVKADSEVDCAQHKLCVGHYYEEEVATKDGPVTVRRYCPPNERAIRFWQLNRQRKHWVDTQRHEHSGPGGGPIEITDPYRDVSVEELRALIAEAKQILSQAEEDDED
jgi:hypothetical protein